MTRDFGKAMSKSNARMVALISGETQRSAMNSARDAQLAKLRADEVELKTRRQSNRTLRSFKRGRNVLTLYF